MKKLIIVGDSVIKGVSCAPDTGKYKLINDCNFESLSGGAFEVENKAVIGATLSKCAKIFSRCDLSGGHDTTVLFSFGGNDSNFNWKEISEDPSGFHVPATKEKDLAEGYAEMISHAAKAGCSVMMTNLVPIDPHKFFDTISKGLNAENILKWLGDKDMLYRWHEHYNCIVESIASSVKCPMADIRTPFIISHDYRDLLSVDGIHPTEKGHEIIHRSLGEVII